MAITQQLARVPRDRLDRCMGSVAELDDLCSFRSLATSDYLDLDWSPALLESAAEAGGVDTALVSHLRRATEGRFEVNPAYRDVPDSIFEHPVSALEPGDVHMVTEALVRLDADDFLADVRPGDVVGLRDLTEPLVYLRNHWLALVSFYRDAAARDLAVVMWWD